MENGCSVRVSDSKINRAGKKNPQESKGTHTESFPTLNNIFVMR